MAIQPIPGAIQVSGGQVIQPDEPFSPRTPEPCTVVIFGAAGDLVTRKLMPSLFHLARGEHLPDTMTIVGVDRVDLDNDTYRAQVAKGNVRAPGLQTMILPNPKDWSEFLKNVTYFKADLSDEKAILALKKYLEEQEALKHTPPKRLFYLALPPSIFPNALKTLHDTGLVGPQTRGENSWARVIIEKPFGRDLESARKLNALTGSMLTERETYRIDHYLGKETVQNTMFFRFANGMFEPLWNYKYIESIQITAFEPLGVEKRGGYYEEAGALRDMIQNHLMQALSLITMEAPVTFDAESIRDEKVKVLRGLRPIKPEQAITETIRGQYSAGRIGRNEVPAYRNEPNVSPTSNTETYAAVRLFIDNWRWSGVPIYLRTGKRIAKQDTEVIIQFRKPPFNVFKALLNPPSPNQLILQIQPNDGIKLNFEAKVPGSDSHVKTVSMDFSYPAAFTVENPSAYERLLVDAMLGDQTLFIRSDEVENAWKFIDPILQGWKLHPDNVYLYKAGSWGPEESDKWIEADGYKWHNA